MPLSDTERKIRTKRRLGCGFVLIVFAVALLLSLALFYLLVLRLNPNPPLGPWIPPEAEAAASARLDLNPPDAAGLIAVLAPALGLSPSDAQGKKLDQSLAVLRFFFHPQVLVAARLEPRNLQVSWAAVANVKRAERFLAAALARLFRDSIRWNERSGPFRRFQMDGLGLAGALGKTQVFLSNDPEWLNRVLALSTQAAPASALERALRSAAPVGLSIADVNGHIAQAIDRLAADPSSPRLAQAAAQAREYIRLLEPPAALDVDFWPSPKAARLVARPSRSRISDRAKIEEWGRRISSSMKQALGGNFAIETAVAEGPEGLGLEVRLPLPLKPAALPQVDSKSRQ